MIKVNDIVVVSRDLPQEGLCVGMKGVVVAVFDMPRIAYEVEFSDAKGCTEKIVAMLPDQITKV